MMMMMRMRMTISMTMMFSCHLWQLFSHWFTLLANPGGRGMENQHIAQPHHHLHVGNYDDDDDDGDDDYDDEYDDDDEEDDKKFHF